MIVSVIICTYNSCESLKKTMDSLYNQKFNTSFDYEIIVIDNNSKDNTREVIENYIPKFSNKLKYLFEPLQGKCFALNRGIQEAKGEIIAFTDSDIILHEKWLCAIYEGFNSFKCGALQGRIFLNILGKKPAWLSERFMKSLAWLDYGNEPLNINTGLVGANMAFRKEIFINHGLFNTRLKGGSGAFEDTEFSLRIRKAGVLQVYYPDAVVYHQIPYNRVTKKALRRNFFIQGYSDFFFENINTSLFKLTGYIIKEIMKEVIGVFVGFLKQDEEEMLWCECRISSKLGFLKSFVENKKNL